MNRRREDAQALREPPERTRVLLHLRQAQPEPLAPSREAIAEPMRGERSLPSTIDPGQPSELHVDVVERVGRLRNGAEPTPNLPWDALAQHLVVERDAAAEAIQRSTIGIPACSRRQGVAHCVRCGRRRWHIGAVDGELLEQREGEQTRRTLGRQVDQQLRHESSG